MIFGIDIPVLKAFIAFFLIYLGILVLLPDHTVERLGQKKCNQYESDNNTHTYDILFKNKTLDFRNISYSSQQTCSITMSFSDVTIIFDKRIPTRIVVTSQLSSVELPDQSSFSCGKRSFETHPNHIPQLVIYVTVSFGKVKLVKG